MASAPVIERPVIIAALQKNQRERLRVALEHFQGHDLIDFRIAIRLTEAAEVWTPTKKGVALNVSLLPDLRAAVVEAERQAFALGLIRGAA